MKIIKNLFLLFSLFFMTQILAGQKNPGIQAIVYPRHYIEVFAPVTGVVEYLNFLPGTSIEAGESLTSVFSLGFHKDFTTALMSYLYAKKQLSHCEEEFNRFDKLFKDKLASSSEYASRRLDMIKAQHQYFSAKIQLSYLQDRLPQQIEPDNIEASDLDAIIKDKKYLHINILATASGILLYPSAKNKLSDLLTVGKLVKEFQTLFYIADFSQIVVSLPANQSLSKLPVGSDILVKNLATSEAVLKGTIVEHLVLSNHGNSSHLSPRMIVSVDQTSFSPENLKNFHPEFIVNVLPINK